MCNSLHQWHLVPWPSFDIEGKFHGDRPRETDGHFSLCVCCVFVAQIRKGMSNDQEPTGEYSIPLRRWFVDANLMLKTFVRWAARRVPSVTVAVKYCEWSWTFGVMNNIDSCTVDKTPVVWWNAEIRPSPEFWVRLWVKIPRFWWFTSSQKYPSLLTYRFFKKWNK